MTRGQRTAHRRLWMVLAPLLVLLLGLALLGRSDATSTLTPSPPRAEGVR